MEPKNGAMREKQRIRKSRKKIKRMKEEYDKKRRNYINRFLKNDFEGEVSLNDYVIESTGNFLNNRNFVFSYDANVEGLVKKVGRNYILNAGNLVGGQIEIPEEKKVRDVDVYMPYLVLLIIP